MAVSNPITLHIDTPWAFSSHSCTPHRTSLEQAHDYPNTTSPARDYMLDEGASDLPTKSDIAPLWDSSREHEQKDSAEGFKPEGTDGCSLLHLVAQSNTQTAIDRLGEPITSITFLSTTSEIPQQTFMFSGTVTAAPVSAPLPTTAPTNPITSEGPALCPSVKIILIGIALLLSLV
ncbi:hypothetical protein BDV23DRAFT_186816 [Aspergillus alliaceus]|uniref:Uncharacterized protein n=1 Tax=Petromyces alliaceus TaxID=209559 RepID=A0A5N7BZD3_PETAA|nr:hypothetical protein BDV23DRAFT_186816 [Aspergillus alliaceus]